MANYEPSAGLERLTGALSKRKEANSPNAIKQFTNFVRAVLASE